MGNRTQPTNRADDDDDDLPGLATTVSGQSVSMSGSVGSPSSRSEQTMATPASDNTFLRLNHLDIHGDDAGSQGAVGSVFLFHSFNCKIPRLTLDWGFFMHEG